MHAEYTPDELDGVATAAAADQWLASLRSDQWRATPVAELIEAAKPGRIILTAFSGFLMIAALPGADRDLERVIRERQAEVSAVLDQSRPTRDEARAWFALESRLRTPMPGEAAL